MENAANTRPGQPHPTLNPTRIKNLAVAALLAVMAGGGYGCWHQFPSSEPQLYLRSAQPQTPLGAAYPGTRELMNAPSNDPALNNDRNWVELRP